MSGILNILKSTPAQASFIKSAAKPSSPLDISSILGSKKSSGDAVSLESIVAGVGALGSSAKLQTSNFSGEDNLIYKGGRGNVGFGGRVFVGGGGYGSGLGRPGGGGGGFQKLTGGAPRSGRWSRNLFADRVRQQEDRSMIPTLQTQFDSSVFGFEEEEAEVGGAEGKRTDDMKRYKKEARFYSGLGKIVGGARKKGPRHRPAKYSVDMSGFEGNNEEKLRRGIKEIKDTLRAYNREDASRYRLKKSKPRFMLKSRIKFYYKLRGHHRRWFRWIDTATNIISGTRREYKVIQDEILASRREAARKGREEKANRRQTRKALIGKGPFMDTTTPLNH